MTKIKTTTKAEPPPACAHAASPLFKSPAMPETLAPDAPASTAPRPIVAPLEPIRVRAKFFFEGDRKFFIKGVTYGPFAPDAEGHFVGDPAKARRDFALMQEMGINLVRIYHIPPKWFLDLCR